MTPASGLAPPPPAWNGGTGVWVQLAAFQANSWPGLFLRPSGAEAARLVL